MKPVQVRINGEPRTLAGSTTVRALLRDLGAEREGVAVAVNDELVLRSTWETTQLRDDDRVEVLSAAPGG
jgi:sulfur carrier protein